MSRISKEGWQYLGFGTFLFVSVAGGSYAGGRILDTGRQILHNAEEKLVAKPIRLGSDEFWRGVHNEENISSSAYQELSQKSVDKRGD